MRIIKYILSFFLVCFLVLTESCKVKMINWQYQVECNGLGAQGVQSLRIKTKSHKKSELMESAKKNAVHSMIFRGAPIGEIGCPKIPMIPISSENEEKNRAFFKNFFRNGGEYQTFIASSPVLTAPVVLIRMGEWEAEYTIGIRYNALKEYLKQNGIINTI